MKRFPITPLFLSIPLLLLCVTARADLCLLKADATVSDTMCSAADAADGTTDNIIHLTVEDSEATLATKVFFDMRGKGGSFYGIDMINHKLSFSPNADLSSPDSCEGTGCTTAPTCSMPEVPAVFDYQAASDCAKSFSSGSTAFPAGIYINLGALAMGSGLTKTTTFVISTITFANEGASGTEYIFKFDPLDEPDGLSMTDVQSNMCSVFGASGCTDLPQQVIYETRVTVTKPAGPTCTTTAPTAPTISCKGTPGTPSSQTGYCTPGTPAVGEAEAVMDFTLPTACTYSDSSTCNINSSTAQLTFTSADLSETDKVLTGSSADPYRKFVDVNTNIAAFTAVAQVTSSDGTVCSVTSPITVSSVACSCGKLPKVTPSVAINSITTYENQSVTIEFTLSDLDDSLLQSAGGPLKPSAIPDGGIILYYVVGTGATEIKQDLDVRDTLDLSAKTFTVTIPGDALVAGEQFYLAVEVNATGGLTGRFPAAFRIDSVANFIADTGTEATSKPIEESTNFDFAVEDGQKQYPRPDRYPFHAGNDVLRMYFKLNNKANVSAQIYSLDGTLVRHLDSSTSKLSDCTESNDDLCNMCTTTADTENRYGCIWDGTTYEGGTRYVANGLYIVNIHAICTAGPYKGSTIDHTKGIVVIK